MAKNKGGRPAKLDDPRTREKYLTNLRKTKVLGAAARKTGLSENTVNAYRRKDPEFEREVWDILEEAYDDAEVCIFKHSSKNPGVAFRLLSLVRPDRWSHKEQVVHSGAVDVKVIEDGSWYNNNAHAQSAVHMAPEGSAPSTGGSVIDGAVQGRGVRTEMGEDGDGLDGDS